MLVKVIFKDNPYVVSLEYYSKFNSIKNEGIKEEIRKSMTKIFGKSATSLTVKEYYKVESEK